MSLALVFSIKRYLFLPFGLEARRGTTPSLRNEARAGCFPRVGHAYNKRPEEAKSGRAEIRLRGKKKRKAVWSLFSWTSTRSLLACRRLALVTCHFGVWKRRLLGGRLAGSSDETPKRVLRWNICPVKHLSTASISGILHAWTYEVARLPSDWRFMVVFRSAQE